MAASTVTVGGTITWDVVISIAISLISVLAAFFNLKNKVDQVETNVNALEDNVDEQLRLTKTLENNLNVNLDKKIAELNVEINKLTKDLFNLKEHMQQIIVTDINDLEQKLKQEISKLEIKIETNIEKYDQIVQRIDNKINEGHKQSINEIEIRLRESAKGIYKHIDEFREVDNRLNEKILGLELRLADITSKYSTLNVSAEKDKDNQMLLFDNINIIIDYIKNDLEDLKQSVRLISSN